MVCGANFGGGGRAFSAPYRADLFARQMRRTEIAGRHITSHITDRRWRSWAAQLLPTLTTDAVIAWLDADQPDPDRAAAQIRRVVDAVIEAAHSADADPS